MRVSKVILSRMKFQIIQVNSNQNNKYNNLTALNIVKRREANQ